MSNAKGQRVSTPVEEALDPEVVAFRQQFDAPSPLDELVREGARQMLQAAIDAEVETFIQKHQDRRDESGKRLVVKNGKLPTRGILTGAGQIEVTQGRVRDNTADSGARVQFTPSVLPAYLRQHRGDRRADSLALSQRSFDG